MTQRRSRVTATTLKLTVLLVFFDNNYILSLIMLFLSITGYIYIGKFTKQIPVFA